MDLNVRLDADVAGFSWNVLACEDFYKRLEYNSAWCGSLAICQYGYAERRLIEVGGIGTGELYFERW